MLFCKHCRHVCVVSGAGSKQEVFASKKTCSYWWKKAPHQPITKLYGKPRDLVAGEQGKLWEGRQRKIDSSSDGERDSDRDSEF